MSTYLISLPRAEAAKKPENLDELESQFQFVYRIAENGETAELVGLYDGTLLPDDADYIIIPFSSSFDYNDNLWAGDQFVNVLGSSGDRPTSPFSGLSWIDFYDHATQQTGITRVNNCVTDGNYYIGKVPIKAGCDSSYCPHCGNRKNTLSREDYQKELDGAKNHVTK